MRWWMVSYPFLHDAMSTDNVCKIFIKKLRCYHDFIEYTSNISDTYTNDAVFCKIVILAHKGGARNGTRILDRV